MVDMSLNAWLLMIALVLLSSISGFSISARLSWSGAALKCHLHRAFGVALAPFLAGLASVSVLLLFPGASLFNHLFVIVAELLGLTVFARWGSVRRIKEDFSLRIRPVGESLLTGLLVVWFVMLLINVTFLPMVQNDALEYSIVSRLLYETRDLASYPAINPSHSSSGFFGPWTHPPLYVALSYVTQLIQGHANEPGFIRLVAPWYLISSTCLMVTIGRLYSPVLGLISALLYISTPILFQGVSGSLIDALPVSAMVLLIAAVVGLHKDHSSFPVVVGGVLGIGLWTHSQAILFIPLVVAALCVREGVGHWKRLLKDIFISLLVAVFVGGGWYIRNIFLFGSPISDNPQIFALSELDWHSYFHVARGLDHFWAILQFGVFKGWFVIESFSLVFWGFSAGIVLFVGQQGIRGFFQVFTSGAEANGDRNSIFWLAGGLTLTYLCGVMLSAALGIDLMIRNDRYLLLVLPLVVFFAAFFLEFIFYRAWSLISCSTVRPAIKDVVLTGYWLVGLLFLLQVVLVGWYSVWRDVSVPKDQDVEVGERLVTRGDESIIRIQKILDLWPSFKVHRTLDRHVPENALVLSMRPADMYYAKRKMVSYLDPRLLPFYLEKSPYKAVEILHGLGINYVFSPDYSLPSIYNSSLMAILADPQLSRLALHVGASQLYELKSGGSLSGSPLDLTPGIHPWVKSWQTRYGMQSILEIAGFEPLIFNGGESKSTFSFFSRDYSVLLSTGKTRYLSWGKGADSIPVEPGEYVIRVAASGEGYCVLWLAEFDENGVTVDAPGVSKFNRIRIGDFPLTLDKESFNYYRRVKLDSKTRYIRIGFEHRGKSKVKIDKLTLEPVMVY